jgi:hypothetical protein
MYKLILFLLIVSFLKADDFQTVIAIGKGSNQENANQVALHNAVEQVIGSFVDSSLYSKKETVLNEKIYSSVGAFVKSYQILKVVDIPDGKAVTIRADIKTEDLNKNLHQLGLLMQKLDIPRILVINLKEGKSEYQELNNKCYMGIIQSLANGGLFLIDKSEQESFAKEQKNTAYTELNNKIADYGLRINADYIIRYDFKISLDQNSLYADAEVLSPSTGKVIFSTDEVASLENSRNEVDQIMSAKNAGKQLGERLLAKIVENWKFMAEDGSYFVLVMEGYSGYNQILSFQKWLTDIKVISAVSEIESSDQKTTLLIKFTGSRKDLKEKIFKLFTQKGWVTRLVRSENNRAFIKILK